MLASVVIEYSVKSLNKVFDYKIPQELTNIIKVGHKVIVPFGNKNVEGFVLKIHNDINNEIEYKFIKEIPNIDFCLNEELLSLGKYLSDSLLCTLISCYQAMLPKALKADIKTNINIKYDKYISINKEIDVFDYINTHKRNKKEIEILSSLVGKRDLKRNYDTSCVKRLIEKGLIVEEKEESKREVLYEKIESKNIELNLEQKNAVDEVLKSNDNKFLLYGVTGSGKTEVYIELIKKYIEIGKNSIVLVPEISLTPQIVSRFKNVFGSSVAVFHSALSEGEKYDEYRKILNNEIKVIVGARSAVFMPLTNIGLIIIDECQSTTYKQENNPKYNAIEVAFKRSEYNNCKVLLGSATPLLEQYARAKKGVFHLINLTKRISNSLPKYEIVDMSIEARKHNYIISSVLDDEIKKTLSRGEQVILLLNRRGYSTFLSCNNCGYVVKCPNCDISLIYHKSSRTYSCHYCGYRTFSTTVCPKCHEDAIRDLGLGTEKLQAIVEKKYNVETLRMDADTTSRKNAHQKLISEFAAKKYKILIGTQMISKGLNFENATLVGIINPDSSLSIPDFRSAEKTYELLSQTSGRVGRFNLPGKVIIQTYNKDNYVYNSVIKNDYNAFFNYEMNIRHKLSYPPYYYICSLMIISDKFESASDVSNKVKKYLDNNLNEEYIILGPSISSIVKLKNKYRFNILIKYKKDDKLRKVLKEINDMTFKNTTVDININI